MKMRINIKANNVRTIFMGQLYFCVYSVLSLNIGHQIAFKLKFTEIDFLSSQSTQDDGH